MRNLHQKNYDKNMPAGPKKIMAFGIPDGWDEIIDEAAQEFGGNRSMLIRAALKEYLESKGFQLPVSSSEDLLDREAAVLGSLELLQEVG